METKTRHKDRIVEVFRTNVPDDGTAEWLLAILEASFPGSRINFDLTDCDKVLRVETVHPVGESIKEVVTGNGFLCEELE